MGPLHYEAILRIRLKHMANSRLGHQTAVSVPEPEHLCAGPQLISYGTRAPPLLGGDGEKTGNEQLCFTSKPQREESGLMVNHVKMTHLKRLCVSRHLPSSLSAQRTL